MTTRLFRRATLAVALATMSSTAAMAQSSALSGSPTETTTKSQPDWLQNLTERITLNGYAQAGWAYQDQNGKKQNSYNLGVYKGISTLFEMGFGISYEYCVVIMAVLTAVYVILGGYKATAMNDFVQGVIMLIVFFIVISLMIALNPPTFIAQLMGISWGALAGAFLAPFMLGLYWRGVTTAAVWACFVWGVGLTVVNMLLGNPINPINCGAIAMVGGFPVTWLVSLISPKLDRSLVNKIFECYK